MDVTIDWETRSPVDIQSRGLFPYAEHPDTEIMCLAVAVDAGKPALWVPDKFLSRIDRAKVPVRFLSAPEAYRTILQADRVVAHNSMFEYVIWREIAHKRLGWPELPLEKMYDTMAQAAYHALPFSLGQVASTLGLAAQKDDAGRRIMLKLCKPRKARKAERESFAISMVEEMDDGSWYHPESSCRFWLWNEDPGDLEALFRYCAQDVDTERMLFYTLAQLPEYERKIWLLDQKINLRGVPVDLAAVRAIVDVTGARETEQLARFAKLTGGAVSSPRSFTALKDWVNQQTGGTVESVSKASVEELLKQQLPSVVEAALRIKAELSKSSVAKFTAMLEQAGADGRVRGMFQYGGASTLRWAARGVQLHNQPRDSYGPEVWEDVAELFQHADVEGLRLLYDDPFYVASRCVRGALATNGETEFITVDFSSVEARGNAHLAGDEAALDVFRSGRDPYKVAAESIFGVPYEAVTKAQRQVGKVSELALGYGGGIGAYAAMAAGYGIDLETLPAFVMPYALPEELDGPYGARALAKAFVARNADTMSVDAAVACDVIKRKWRAAHPEIVRFWKGLEQAAYAAVENPGRVYAYRSIQYCVSNRFLKCKMPSGRLMHYFNPRISGATTSWGEEKQVITYEGMKVVEGSTTRQWARLPTYGGRLVENVVQGFCRDLLAEAMLRLEAAGYPVVLHVHDEAAAERPVGAGNLEEFVRIMSEVPPWAAGMPISAEGWVGKRYRK